MTRLYSDENFPLPVVEALRELGHDVLTCFDAGQGGQAIPDEEVLAFAVAEQRGVLTINRKDFIRLHLQQKHHHGIIVCTFNVDFLGQARQIDEALRQVEEPSNQLIRINRLQG